MTGLSCCINARCVAVALPLTIALTFSSSELTLVLAGFDQQFAGPCKFEVWVTAWPM
jgi:hypothetical protein